MTVLNKEILYDSGPYIEFTCLKQPLLIPENDWPSKDLYSTGTFFELADSLLDTYCTITKQYSFFDLYEVTEYTTPAELFKLATSFIEWAALIALTDDPKILREKSFYRESYPANASITEFRCDLIETLLFISGKIIESARNEHTITIVGI